MTISLTLVSLALFAAFVYGAVSNAISVWQSVIRKERFPSRPLTPVLAGAMGTVALAIFPFGSLLDWRWLPLFLDVGCVPAFVVLSAIEGRRQWIEWRLTSPFLQVTHLQHEEAEDFRLVVKLYKNGQVRLLKTNIDPRLKALISSNSSGQALLKTDIDPRPYWEREYFWLDYSHSGTWWQEGDTLIFKLSELEITYRQIAPDKYEWVKSNKANDFDAIDLKKVCK